MKQGVFHVSSLFFILLVAGTFWGTWFTLTRSIEAFSPEEYIHIGKVIIENVAAPMRFIMPTAILLVLLSVVTARRQTTPGFYLGIFALVLLIVVLLITLIVLVPIDNDIKEWTTETVPGNFEEIRLTWKNFHAVRTFAALTAFLCFAIFVWSDAAAPKNRF